MPATETVIIETTTLVAGAVRQTGGLALLAPLDGDATVSANVVKKYRRASDVKTDHGDGSLLHEGAKAAFGSGIASLFAIGVDEVTGSPFSQTRGDTAAVNEDTDANSGGVFTNMPLTSVTSASRDGTNILAGVKFTTADPSTITPAAAELYINPKTGKWKLGTATTGGGPGLVITFSSHDWTSAFEVLENEVFEYLVPAGSPFTAANYGIYDAFVTEAIASKKVVAGALASGVAPGDVDGSPTNFDVQGFRNGLLYLIAGHYTGDLTSAIGAYLAKSRVNATTKEQLAPTGVTFTQGYLRSEYGDEESPASGTFHYIGVNAVYKDEGGSYRITNDRADTGLTDFYRFHSSYRSVRYCEVSIESDVIAARRASNIALPYTDQGIAAIKTVIEGVLGRIQKEGVIDEYIVTMPALADISSTDRLNRVLPGVDVYVRLAGQIHLVKLDLGVNV